MPSGQPHSTHSAVEGDVGDVLFKVASGIPGPFLRFYRAVVVGHHPMVDACLAARETGPFSLHLGLVANNVSRSPPRLPRHAAPLNDADSALFSSPLFQSRQLCSWWPSHQRATHLELRGWRKTVAHIPVSDRNPNLADLQY